MAQRKEARIFVTIWDDPAFRAHKPGPQRMYLYLLSQIDLSYCGVISLRPRRWASDADGLTVDQVEADLKLLAEPFPEGFREPFPEGGDRPLIVIDEDAGELLVRSLVRNDGIWKQPNLLKSARESATLVRSPRIKAALLEELHSIPVDKSPSPQVKAILTEFIADLEQGLSASPQNPFGKGSADPSRKGSQGVGGVLQPVDAPAPNPQETPAPPAAPANAHTGESPDTVQLEDLIADIRTIRPDWSHRQILRALTRPKVTARPFPVVRRALTAVARDPETNSPGRLEHDGPWWRDPPEPPPTRPPWCGACDRATRRVADPETGRDAGRCPNCHPLGHNEEAMAG